MTKNRQLDAWQVTPEAFPGDAAMIAKLEYVTRYAVLAPSTHNTQPWWFRIVEETIELHADRSRALPIADPDSRELLMSCGAALLNLRLAMRRFGYTATVRTFPDAADPDLLARVTMTVGPATSDLERDLFDAIARRRTNRQRFTRTAVVDEAAQRKLQSAALTDDAWLVPIWGEPRGEISALVDRADRARFRDRRYRRELAEWLLPNRSERGAGVPGYALGFGTLASYVLPAAVRTFDLGRLLALRDRRLAKAAGLLAVLGTSGDGPGDWLTAGQASERVALTAETMGLSTSYLGQPLEHAGHRDRVRELVNNPGCCPQQILGFGPAPAVRATPRRRFSEVIQRGQARA